MIKTYLDVVDSPLPKNWEIFEILVIILCVLPWLILIVYLLFFKKYKLRYFVGEKEVYTDSYKSKDSLKPFEYNGSCEWYLDKEYTVKFDFNKNLEKNTSVYLKEEKIDE